MILLRGEGEPIAPFNLKEKKIEMILLRGEGEGGQEVLCQKMHHDGETGSEEKDKDYLHREQRRSCTCTCVS